MLCIKVLAMHFQCFETFWYSIAQTTPALQLLATLIIIISRRPAKVSGPGVAWARLGATRELWWEIHKPRGYAPEGGFANKLHTYVLHATGS